MGTKKKWDAYDQHGVGYMLRNGRRFPLEGAYRLAPLAMPDLYDKPDDPAVALREREAGWDSFWGQTFYHYVQGIRARSGLADELAFNEVVVRQVQFCDGPSDVYYHKSGAWLEVPL